ncbi:hypothetical protein CAC01_00130 [Streptomyces sp. CLI2509]|nr:hypothetical protein CAC01_00130 [Streptomyces sp. CLI2509]
MLAMSRERSADVVPVMPGTLLYLGRGRRGLPLRAVSDARATHLGGEPIEEKLLMRWNVVGRAQEEIGGFVRAGGRVTPSARSTGGAARGWPRPLSGGCR